MKKIPLNKGMFALVDDEDYTRLSEFKWHTNKIGNNHYVIRFVSVEGKKKAIYMHRVIMNSPPGILTDHRDFNGLNNQKHNLRLATNSQNSWNRGMSKNNTSGYKGVFWDHSKGKWVSRIMANRKTKMLGRFKTKEEAAAAYNAGCELLHGEYGCKNSLPGETN